MLEKVKPGDLCVFSDGDQAKVTSVKIVSSGKYDLYFDKPVSGYKGGGRYSHWVYKCDGVLSNLTESEYIRIVKLIAE